LGSLPGLAGVLALLGVTYWLTGQALLASADPHITCGIVLFLLGGLATAVIAAIGVPAEKESGAWALLLATPLHEREIILGKAVGGLRRSLPAWLPLFFHLGLFTVLGAIHPIVLPLVAIVVFGNACLLTGSGLFWGVLLKRTATAAVANLLVLIGVWFGLPMVLSIALMFIAGMLAAAKVMVFEPMMGLFMLHPFMEIGVILNGAAGDHARLALARMTFQLAGGENMRIGIALLTLVLALVMAGYAAAGGFLAWAAMGLVRRRAF
ncbi:MAG: hypothetical protein NTX87_20835, partial [Planctomycetota bacterium]|nr:hypothetical protein [Planctomycetota bacterium]